MWTDKERRNNNREILRGNIERDSVGRRLTDQAKERAVDFAENVWKGQMGNGQASQLGIKHVTSDVFKK
jgi:hypothetical protein